GEHEIQRGDDGPAGHDVEFDPPPSQPGRGATTVLRLDEVGAAGERGLSVDDDDLAVIAQVRPGRAPSARPERQERMELDGGPPEPAGERPAARDPRRPARVV